MAEFRDRTGRVGVSRQAGAASVVATTVYAHPASVVLLVPSSGYRLRADWVPAGLIHTNLGAAQSPAVASSQTQFTTASGALGTESTWNGGIYAFGPAGTTAVLVRTLQ